MVNGSWLMAQSSTLIWAALNTYIHIWRLDCSILRSTDQFGIHTWFGMKVCSIFQNIPTHHCGYSPNSSWQFDAQTGSHDKMVMGMCMDMVLGTTHQTIYIHTYIHTFIHAYIHTYVLSSFKNNRHCHGPGHGLGHGKWLELIWGAIGPASGWLRPISSWLRPIWSCNDSLHTWYIHTELQQKQ